jgi:hypothetical protein
MQKTRKKLALSIKTISNSRWMNAQFRELGSAMSQPPAVDLNK